MNMIKYWLLEPVYRALVVVSVMAQRTNAPLVWRMRLSIARAAVACKQIDYLIEVERKHLNK